MFASSDATHAADYADDADDAEYANVADYTHRDDDVLMSQRANEPSDSHWRAAKQTLQVSRHSTLLNE